MKLYYFPPSPNSRKVVAVALHLDITLDLIPVDLTKGEQKKPEFLKLNPNGKTPTLVDGDFALWESNAIMEYLASKKPSSLLPGDAKARADVTRWQSWKLAHWGPATETLIWENMVKKLLNAGDPDAAALKKAEESFHPLATVLNNHLQGRDYLTGNNVTIADFSVASPLAYAEPARIPLQNYPNIRNWYARIDKLESWQKSAPPKT